MKKRYLILIMLCFILFIVSVGGISATEDVNQAITEDTGNLVVSQSDGEITGSADNGTFTVLQKKINEASEGSVINLENDYAYDLGFSADGITINKELTINGNGYAIDASGQSRIFNIASDNVILTDITFKNGNATDNGGAVCWYGADGTVNNCNFINNKALLRGGAIYWCGADGLVNNSNFTNNTARKFSGGAIQWDLNATNGTVNNCNFINNTGTQKGGAVLWCEVNGSIIGCNFINNTSINGGAIFWDTNAFNCAVNNSSFIYNTGNDGGAIYWFGAHGKMTGCNFTNNRGTNGGAISWQRTYGLLNNCNFINNTATAGGAVYWEGTNGTGINCNFTNNTAGSDGGAIYWYAYNGTVNSCNFAGNTAESDGGAVYWDGTDGTVNSCNFAGNTAESDGGAVYFADMLGNVTITADFINNTADCGGAVYFANELINVTIIGDYLNNKAASNGSALFINELASNVTISGKFINNQAISTVYINQTGSDSIVHDSVFINNDGTDIFINSGEARVLDTWFGNNATDYSNKPEAVNVDMANWLFLNATAEPNKVMLNKSSSVTFNLYSYNETSKEIGEYGASQMDIILELSQTLGELNQTAALVGDEIEYTSKHIGNATVTGKFESAYNTLSILSFTSVNGTDLFKVFRNGTQYSATFLDSEGNYLKEGTAVRFKINGVMYERKVSGDKGLAYLNINLEAGKYNITNYNTVTGEENTNTVTVISRLIENKDLIKYYRNATQYTVKVIGDDGKAVGAGETVTFNVNGVLYNRTTNESGIAKLNINLHPGKYIITAEYKNCRVSNNITVLQVLTAKDLTKKYGTPDQFVATLLDGQGKPYADQTVRFNINGVLYNRSTDGSGQAKLNINLMPGEYIITSSFNGTNVANNITVKS